MKTTSRIGYFLQEIAIVVVGVLIAVSINNYKEKVDNEKYIEKTLSAIENEIKMSQTDLDTTLNRHLRLLEYLENNIEDNEQTIAEMVANRGGFQVPNIKNISLRFFIANKADLVDFALISQLQDIEIFSNSLSRRNKMLADFAYENVNENSYEVKIRFYYLLANVIDGETTLSEAYSDFLENNKDFLQSEKRLKAE